MVGRAGFGSWLWACGVVVRVDLSCGVVAIGLVSGCGDCFVGLVVGWFIIVGFVLIWALWMVELRFHGVLCCLGLGLGLWVVGFDCICCWL